MKVPFRASAPKDSSSNDEMTLLEHLVELRKRIIRSLLAVMLGCIIIFAFSRPIFDFLKQPYCDFQASAEGQLPTELETGDCAPFIVTRPMESFSFLLTLVGYGGLVLATPVILYQIARFVMPGLYDHEKRLLYPFLAGSVILLAFGMVSAYLVMPQALEVLASFGFDGFVAFFSPNEYVGFFVKMLFAFGVAAELPIVLIFLQLVGVVKPDTLAGNRRVAVAAITLLAAIITPTGDPFNLAIVAVPMYIFYEISIIIGRQLVKRKRPAGAQAGLSG